MKLAELFIKLGLRKDGFDKGIKDAKNQTNNFGSAIKKIGGYLAGAFAVNKIVSFTKELVNLGGEADGVRAAFERIADQKTLIDLQKATKGTVSELDLMKRAVTANNLGLPIKNLASLFEFATKRAQDTGESVDYLVNSIVVGIGRKSPLILDNLGISAVQLKEKLGDVGLQTASTADIAKAVGEIAAESMTKSGEIIDTNAIKVQNLTAQWQNFKASLANNEEFKKAAGSFADTIKRELELLPSELSTSLKALKFVFGRTNFKDRLIAIDPDEEKKKADKIIKLWMAIWSSMTGGSKVYEKHIKTIQELEDETQTLKDSIKLYNVSQGDEIQATLRQINANEKLIESLTTLKRIKNETAPAKMKSIGLFGNEFTAPVPDTSSLMPLDNFINQIRERYANLIDDETLRKMKEKFDAVEEASMQFTESIKSAIVSSLQGLGTAIGEALAGGGWDNFGKAILEIIGGFMQTLGAAIIAIGIGLLKLNASLASANPFGVIAAGIALTAAGAALSSIVSGGIKGTSSGSSSASGYSYGGSSASAVLTGDVRFVLEGDKLVGAISNNSRKRSITQ